MSKIILGFLFTLLFCFQAFADGSKDFYPSGVFGNRAFLNSTSNNTADNNAAYPFQTFGTHYVYVKQGETLAVASSANRLGGGSIEVYSPQGVLHSSKTGVGGTIAANNNLSNREAELAGPRIGYQAFEIVAQEEGLWKVEFRSSSAGSSSEGAPANIEADKDWTQHYSSVFIAAWDISVRNIANTEWIPGRVYANILNMQINSGSLANKQNAFFAVNYVLTSDGYLYRVNGNGSNGIAFSYWVNNRGFLDGNNNSIYKSLNDSKYIYSRGYVHDPRSGDTGLDITQKIFYCKPSPDLPTEALGNVPNGKTWLLNKPIEAEVTDIKIIGSEGLDNYVSHKGAYITYNTNIASNYEITLKSKAADGEIGYFKERTIKVSSIEGQNKQYWDGKDGDGQYIYTGLNIPIEIIIQKLGGEVHFPYLDMEINPSGIVIERLDENFDQVVSDIVYWDDKDITQGNYTEELSNPITNLQGISSKLNGHIWGTYSNSVGVSVNNNLGKGNFSFGNEKAMDTWSYVKNLKVVKEEKIQVKVADLEIDYVKADKLKIELGDLVTYEVKVRNNGPSDVDAAPFSFNVPFGMEIISSSFTSSCLIQNNRSLSTTNFKSLLNLKNGCEAIFTFKVKANASDVYGFIPAKATIMRTQDITDPDATNIDVSKIPTDPEEECKNNGIGGVCNNIETNLEVFLLEPVNERGKLALVKSAVFNDENKDTYMQAGESILYQFEIINTGLVTVKNIEISDFRISSSKINVPDLVPNARYVVTKNYVLTALDMDSLSIQNSAIVRGVNPRGFEVIDTSGITENDDLPTITEIDKKPKVYLKKEIINKGTGQNQVFIVGDEILYRFTIINGSEVDLFGFELADSMLFNGRLALNGFSLKPKAELSHDVKYLIQSQDFDRGLVNNSATIFAKEPRRTREISDTSGTAFDNNDSTSTIVAKRGLGVQDSIVLKQNRTMPFDVLKNDIKGSTNFVRRTLRIEKQPINGVVEIVNGSIEYTPNLHYFGYDEFFYTVADLNGLIIHPTLVKIDVQKTIPIAVDDLARVRYHSTVDIFVAKNDLPEEGSLLDLNSIKISKNPTNGVVVVKNNGIVEYAPNQYFTGDDSFTYGIMDNNQNYSNDALVIVNTYGIKIPNVFTPNSDGKNDYFVLIGGGNYDKIDLKIFSQFGSELYHNADYKNDWDGGTLPDQTYLFEINAYKGGNIDFTERGTVLISRKIQY